MKYTIEGFSQQELINLGLDSVDAILLRWFVDFQNTGKMRRLLHDSETYYWVQYQAVIDDLPCIGITNKESLGRRFQKLVKAGVLSLVVHSVGGRFSYFAINQTGFSRLVDSHTTQKSIALDSKVDSLPTQKSGQIDSSTSNPSTKIKEPKHKHGEFNHVLLTSSELDKLKKAFPLDWEQRIKAMDEGIELKGYKYRSHYLAILKWAERDQKSNTTPFTKPKEVDDAWRFHDPLAGKLL